MGECRNVFERMRSECRRFREIEKDFGGIKKKASGYDDILNHIRMLFGLFDIVTGNLDYRTT